MIRARCSVLGNIPGTNMFESLCTCREAQEFRNIKIIRYEESVYYDEETFLEKLIGRCYNLIIESKRFISPDSFAGADPLVAADLEVVKEHRSRMIRAVSRHGIADHVRWTWKRDILLNLILNDSLLFPGHS